MFVKIFTQYFPPEMEPSGFMFSSLARYISREETVETISGFANFPTGKFFDRKRFELTRLLKEGNLHTRRVIVIPSNNRSNLKRITNYLSFMFCSLISALMSPRPKVVLATSPPMFAALGALVYSKLVRRPFVLDVRDVWPESAIQMGSIRHRLIIFIFEKMEVLLYEGSSAIVVATPGMIKHIRSKIDLGDREVIYLPCGVTAYSDPALKAYSFSSSIRSSMFSCDKFVVLYAGLHGHAQNLTNIIECADILRDRNDIEFLLVGDGPEKKYLIDLVHEKELQNVHFVDPLEREEIRSLYCDVDCALVPLRDLDVFKTVFPSKTFELLSFGVPTIVSVGGQISELVKRHKASLSVEADNPVELAASVARLSSNPELRSQLSRNGLKLAREEFDYETVNKKYKLLLERVVKLDTVQLND